MILELVHGFSLEERLRSGPLPISEALHYVDQVLSALAFAHACGVVHRDIKPANILIAAEGIVKLTDFGIARAASDRKLTHTGFALGSLPYMSPEQIQSETVDARSDIYSLGVTCYEAITGIRPFQGENEYALMNAHLAQVPRPPSEIAAVPAVISGAILKALAKKTCRSLSIRGRVSSGIGAASSGPRPGGGTSAPSGRDRGGRSGAGRIVPGARARPDRAPCRQRCGAPLLHDQRTLS